MSPIVRAARVRELWMLRRGEEARLMLDELVGNFPAVAEVEIARGMVALGMRDNPAFLDIGWGSCFQDLAEAEAAFERARALAPRSCEAVRGQAVVLRLRGEYRAACQLLDQALDELGQHAGLLAERAFCESDQSNHEDAAVFLRRALDIDPCTVDARAALCLLLDNRLGNHEEALAVLKQGPTIDEIAGWLYMNHVAHTGEPAEREETRRKARAAFQSVLAAEPRRIGAICGLAWLDYDEHGLRAALDRVDEALATDPFSPHLNYTRGRLLLDLRTPEDAARARECFRQVQGQAPYVVYCWSGLADAAMAVGDLVAADEVWQWMARRFPTNTTTFRVGSNLALKRNQPQAALDLADRALKAAPGRRDLVEQRAAVLLDIGYHAEASQPGDPLQRAAERWPGDVSLRWRLLLRAEAEGRLHQALGTCREIRLLDPVNQLARDKERELRRQIRRRPLYRMFGARVDEEAVLAAGPSVAEIQSLERYAPSDTRLVVSVRLRRLFWREARLSSAEKVVLGRVLASSPKVISILCVVAAALFVWSLLPGEAGFPLSASASAAVLLLGFMVGRIMLIEHYRRRVLATEAEAALVRDLLKLLMAIERERGAGEMARLIESIAHAQARVIRRAGAGDKTLSVYAGQRALGVAAATRDLKQLLVTWDSRTPQVLFRRASRMLDATCRNEWGRFTYRKPDLLPRQVRLRVWSVARLVFMGGVVAMGVWLLLFSRQNPDGASATLAIVTGLVAAIAPVMVPLIEYVTRHGDRLRKASESDRPSYDESSRVRRY